LWRRSPAMDGTAHGSPSGWSCGHCTRTHSSPLAALPDRSKVFPEKAPFALPEQALSLVRCFLLRRVWRRSGTLRNFFASRHQALGWAGLGTSGSPLPQPASSSSSAATIRPRFQRTTAPRYGDSTIGTATSAASAPFWWFRPLSASPASRRQRPNRNSSPHPRALRPAEVAASPAGPPTNNAHPPTPTPEPTPGPLWAGGPYSMRSAVFDRLESSVCYGLEVEVPAGTPVTVSSTELLVQSRIRLPPVVWGGLGVGSACANRVGASIAIEVRGESSRLRSLWAWIFLPSSSTSSCRDWCPRR
jgi:hypothetical protein